MTGRAQKVSKAERYLRRKAVRWKRTPIRLIPGEMVRGAAFGKRTVTRTIPRA